MVIPFENLMLKSRFHKQPDHISECRGILIDYNSNPMSEAEDCENRAQRHKQNGNQETFPNGKSRNLLRRSFEGGGGKRCSGVITDGMEGRNPKRNSTNSKDITEDPANCNCTEEISRESYCSIDSDVLNVYQEKSAACDVENSSKVPAKPKQLMKFTKGLFTKAASMSASGNQAKSPQKIASPDDNTFPESEFVDSGKMKKSSANVPVGKKLDSKIRFFNRKRRNRNKLISNAGSSLWTPLGECSWISASGRQFILRNTNLFSLCDAERAALRQIVLQKLHEFQLGCNITPPKDGNSARRTWKQRLFLGRKDKEHRDTRSSFGVPLAQVIANDVEAEDVNNHEDEIHSGNQRRCIVRQEEVIREDHVDEDELTGSEQDLNNRRNSLPNSYAPLLRSSSFNLDEEEEHDYMESKQISNNDNRERCQQNHSHFRKNCTNNYRRSRLLDALTLSSTSASYISILDRDDELKPPPPQVPKIVLTIIDYLEKHALNVLGIFRTGGLRKRVRHMREELDRGNISIIYAEETNAQDVAALFKEFFRDLPDPLLTRELYSAFLATRKLNDPAKQLAVLQLLIGLLPVPNRDTLSALLSCLDKVASFAKDTIDKDGNTIPGNKMDSRNLATLIGPNILHRVKANASAQSFSQEDSVRLAEENNKMIEVVKEMIENHNKLFQISASLHDEILRSLVDVEPETVDYVLRKKASRISQIEFPDDLQEELSRVPENSNSHPKRAMTFGATRRPKVASRFGDEGPHVRSSLRLKQSPNSSTALRKNSTPDRPGSIRSVMSTTSEPDRFSYRKSNSSFHSYHGAPGNRRSQSESVEAPFEGQADQTHEADQTRMSYRDSGLGLGRNSHRFSMEETRKRISALESIQPASVPQGGAVSKSSTPYSSPTSTPILERLETDTEPVKKREWDSRESRDSAYASGRFTRKGGAPYQGVQGIFSLGEEDLSPDASMTSGSPASPVFLSDILDEPSFNNNGGKMSTQFRKLSLPASVHSRVESQTKENDLPVISSPIAEDPEKSQRLERSVRKAFLTWEEATWPHWDQNATKHHMPDQETSL